MEGVGSMELPQTAASRLLRQLERHPVDGSKMDERLLLRGQPFSSKVVGGL